MYKVAIITLSDKGARGEREDVSGRVIREMVEAAGYQVSRQCCSMMTGRAWHRRSGKFAMAVRQS